MRYSPLTKEEHRQLHQDLRRTQNIWRLATQYHVTPRVIRHHLTACAAIGARFTRERYGRLDYSQHDALHADIAAGLTAQVIGRRYGIHRKTVSNHTTGRCGWIPPLTKGGASA